MTQYAIESPSHSFQTYSAVGGANYFPRSDYQTIRLSEYVMYAFTIFLATRSDSPTRFLELLRYKRDGASMDSTGP
jgi:hypothetical protein